MTNNIDVIEIITLTYEDMLNNKFKTTDDKTKFLKNKVNTFLNTLNLSSVKNIQAIEQHTINGTSYTNFVIWYQISRMSELDNNVKKVLDLFDVKTIEEVIEKWNQVNRDMYHLFNCTTLPITLSKRLATLITHLQTYDSHGIEGNDMQTLLSTKEILERQLKKYQIEVKKDE